MAKFLKEAIEMLQEEEILNELRDIAPDVSKMAQYDDELDGEEDRDYDVEQGQCFDCDDENEEYGSKVSVEEVKEFFKNNSHPSSEEIMQFAQEHGISLDELRTLVFDLIADLMDKYADDEDEIEYDDEDYGHSEEYNEYSDDYEDDYSSRRDYDDEYDSYDDEDEYEKPMNYRRDDSEEEEMMRRMYRRKKPSMRRYSEYEEETYDKSFKKSLADALFRGRKNRRIFKDILSYL